MSDLYIEARLQAIKDIASASCSDIKDADNIAGFCDEIYSAIPKLDKIIEELELHSFELGTDTIPVHYVRLNEAIEIVKRESEKYNNGWISCSVRLPEEAFGCLVTVIDCEPSTQTDFENILPYFVGYDGETWNDADGKEIPFEVIAWMPLPKPYKESD